MNTLIFDKSMAKDILANDNLIKASWLVAYRKEDDTFEIMKDWSGRCLKGQVVPFSMLSQIMSDMMFHHLYTKGM